MDNELEHLSSRLQKDGAKTRKIFEELAPEDWRVQVYTTGSEWTVREILAHFVSAERSFHQLINDVRAGGEGAPRSLDIDDYNESQVPKLDDLSPDQLLDEYWQARQSSIELTESLEPADLDKEGYHPWFGEVPIRDMLKLVYRHNMIHLRDLRKALRQGGPVPHKEIEPPSA